MAAATASPAVSTPPTASPHYSSLEDWLPITASRNAKWWYSAFHNVTAIVGAGVLSFPIAMRYLGWGGGAAAIGLSWVVTLFTMWQLVEMHESTEEVSDGKGGVTVRRRRFDRYHELGQRAFGQRLGLWIVIPQQLIIDVGIDIVYMVTGGQSLMKFACLITYDHNHSKTGCGKASNCGKLLATSSTGHSEYCFPYHLNQTYWILIFASVHFFLAQIPSFNSLALVSFVAAAMSLSYSTIAWIAALLPGSIPYFSTPAEHCYPKYAGVLNALGQIAFAYASHNVALEIQATMPSTPERPSKKPMMQGVVLAYVVVAICYFPVAFVGYYKFGRNASENILIALEGPTWLIAVANFMVVIHMIGSYQLYAMPVFDLMETVLVKVLHFQPSFQLRLIVRTIYVAFTCLVAIAIPFFQALLGLFGGFAFTPLTYFIPCIIWLRIRKPKLLSFSGVINCVCIILGVLLMIASTIGAILLLKENIKQYDFFSRTLANTCAHA